MVSQMNKYLYITIIGGGYVGLVTGTCLAHLGHDVTIVDIDETKINAINSAIPPIYENGLSELLKNHIGKNLRASTEYTSVSESDVIFIAVGTPPNPDGSANLSYIRSAAENIANQLVKHSTPYPVIVVKSTVPPGTTQNIVRPVLASKLPEQSFDCCMNPEFLREGRAIDDFLHPDRIVLGTTDERTLNVMKNVYSGLDVPVLTTGSTAAEMIKYTANAFLATKISFSNEIGNLCKQLDVDVYEVMKGVGLDHRISPHFLNAGAGFGGSCFPKDVSALAALSETAGVHPILLQAVLAVNESQPLQMIRILERHLPDLKEKRIAVLGLAFKDNTDDIRESRSIPVIASLLGKNAVPVCYDPMAGENMKHVFPNVLYCNSAREALINADACLVMTEWSEFSQLSEEFDGMKSRIIIDGRHILTISDAEGVCW
ncbi:UDP-glucose/GDP-mannose dehydrogenase family protein [Methanorbis rubei]|uniref:UDP-glucose 6-dehydrogenase n=1 Tax=Methanorbis rubei TaxID=3028300 RepID=A0AAE4MGT9_9EURY|nr:UDP-glucose 6-dehydrogenase YwqF [Methanocorpusculaceae archaeon Cs1]